MNYTRQLKVVAIAVGIASAMGPASWALDITVANPAAGAFGVDARGLNVDQAVMPGNEANQSWDLEAFVIQNSKLYVIGGFNFAAGNDGFLTGDIFLDSNGGNYSPSLGGLNGIRAFRNTVNGYEYAIDLVALSSASRSYNVYALNANSVLNSVYYRQNDAANPYEYKGEGTLAGASLAAADLEASGAVDYFTGLSDAAVLATYGVDLKGGTHNVMGIDMSWMSALGLSTLDVNLTLGCGNDQLNGRMSGSPDRVPDGAATIMLLGIALSGIATMSKRLSKKA